MRDKLYMVAGLGDADIAWLLSMGKLRTLKPGAQLVTAGKPVRDLYFVVGGTLAVVLADGTEVATLGEGEVVGEMSFVEQHAPSTSVVVRELVELLAIPRQAILDRFAQEPVFEARFYRALAIFLSERLRETTSARRAPLPDAPGEDAAARAAEANGDRVRRLLGKILGRDGQ